MSNLQAITLPRQLISLGHSCFRACPKLEIINTESLTMLNRCFSGCSSIEHLNTISVRSITDSYNEPVFGGTKIEGLFLPSLTYYSGYLCSGMKYVKVVDIGPLSTTLGGNSALYGVNTNTLSIVCRASSAPTLPSWQGNSQPKFIFVPHDSVESYKGVSAWSTYASKIYAIGGVEWMAEFGSSDAYADIQMYAPSHDVDKYIAAYEAAKAASTTE